MSYSNNPRKQYEPYNQSHSGYNNVEYDFDSASREIEQLKRELTEIQAMTNESNFESVESVRRESHISRNNGSIREQKIYINDQIYGKKYFFI